MRLKDYAEKEDGKRVWLSEAELSAFIDEAETAQQKIAFLLAGRCGLRRQEIIEVEGQHVVETDTGHVVRVWDGKGSKYREPPAPQQLELRRPARPSTIVGHPRPRVRRAPVGRDGVGRLERLGDLPRSLPGRV